MASNNRFFLGSQTRRREMFLKMYPNFDMRYWHYFFLALGRSGVGHLHVFYRSDKNGLIRIVKGKNDIDPR